jgi:hypothetical protein
VLHLNDLPSKPPHDDLHRLLQTLQRLSDQELAQLEPPEDQRSDVLANEELLSGPCLGPRGPRHAT